jgi:uncharacterized protein YndB with AHSA1/START domain
MITFQTSVGIERPRVELFAYVADPLRLPDWNSAVRSVRSTSVPIGRIGSTYTMLRELPTGPAENTLEIIELEPPSLFTLRATAGPTPFRYRYRFTDDQESAAIIELDASVELTGLTGRLGPLAAHAIKHGVDANLATLKRLQET